MALLSGCGKNSGTYDASGVFESTEIIVSAKVSGEIKEFNILEGDNLASHATVGYIDTTQLYLKKKQLESSIRSLDSRQANVPKQMASILQQIATQERELIRAENLLRSNAGNQKQVDDITAQLNVLKKELAAQQDNLRNNNSSLSEEANSLQLQIDQLDDQIRNAIIHSPAAGTVLSKYAEAGEFASAGKPLFKVSDISTMYLRAYITAGQLTSVKIGQAVTVYADRGESDRQAYDGVISWIADKAEFTPKTIQTRDERANLVYAIKVKVVNDGFIKRGMYGELKLTIDN